jgi:hypothetical protein
MKLVLCSEGFHTPNTVEACVKLVGKPQDQISIGIINEAYAVEEGDKRWVLDNLNSVATNFSGEIDIIDLLALSIEELFAKSDGFELLKAMERPAKDFIRFERRSGLDMAMQEFPYTPMFSVPK